MSLEFLKNNTVDTKGMTILLPMEKKKFITQTLKLLGLAKTKTPVEGAPFADMGMKTKRHNPGQSGLLKAACERWTPHTQHTHAHTYTDTRTFTPFPANQRPPC